MKSIRFKKRVRLDKRVRRVELDGRRCVSASFSIFQGLERPDSSRDIIRISAEQINQAMQGAFNEQIEIEKQRAQQK